jgi:hypothetical protein
MLQIGKVILSFDILQKQFMCDIKKCKGACCVVGDAGAPLEPSETKLLKKIYPKVKPFISGEGIAEIEKQGFFIIDDDGDYVTPLIENKACVYSYIDLGITKCAIEKAYFEKKIKFRKPLSCHLYPIRITKYEKFEAVNYHQNSICNSALLLGNIAAKPLYSFLEEPLSRKYGKKWFKKLTIAIDSMEIKRNLSFHDKE